MVMDYFDSLLTDSSITRKSVEEFLSNDTNLQHRFKNNTVIHSSGSTGVPGLFLYSKEEWSFIAAFVVARISQPIYKILSANSGLLFLEQQKGIMPE